MNSEQYYFFFYLPFSKKQHGNRCPEGVSVSRVFLRFRGIFHLFVAAVIVGIPRKVPNTLYCCSRNTTWRLGGVICCCNSAIFLCYIFFVSYAAAVHTVTAAAAVQQDTYSVLHAALHRPPRPARRRSLKAFPTNNLEGET